MRDRFAPLAAVLVVALLPWLTSGSGSFSDPPRVCYGEDSRPCLSVMNRETSCPNGVIVSLWGRGDGAVHFPTLRVYYDHTTTTGATIPKLYQRMFEDSGLLTPDRWHRLGGFFRTNDVRIVEGRGEFSAGSVDMALQAKRRCK